MILEEGRIVTIKRDDLAQSVIDNSDFTRAQANEFVDNLFEVMSKALASGEEVKIAGFGNFVLRNKKERAGRNPKTKEEFIIAARRVVSFHTSNLLKIKVKNIQPLMRKHREASLATTGREKVEKNSTLAE